MGGRGSSSGVSNTGKVYGTEFKTIFTSGNIKFVQKADGSTTMPKETMTKGRVYVTVNPEYGPQFISYYDTANKKTKTIDLLHKHSGLMPHVHHGYEHNENDGKKGATGPSEDERKMVERVLRLWYNKKGRT